jgi:TonB family protein
MAFLFSLAYSQSTTTWLTPEYVSLIQNRINTNFIYPQEAITQGWEGVVKVRFTLTADGRIKDIDVAESSGYPLLDAAAILAIKDASPYPFPKDSQEGEIEIIVPVRYEQIKPLTSAPQEAVPLSASEKPITQEESQISMPSPQESKVPAQEVIETPQAPAEKPPEEPAQPQESRGLILPPELTYFMHLALQNNQPTRVAQEEVELAQLKVLEAQRNFFPAAKVQAYNTTGEVYRLDYEEREARLEVTQPLYYGGRLTGAMKQAKVNLEITQKNYDRLKFDVMQKTETAYYNLIAAKMNLKQKEELQQEAKELLGKIQKLEMGGMIIPIEAESAANWYDQILLQIDAIKQDLYMAELTLKQVLNIKETPKIEAYAIEAKRLNLDLNNCLEIAFKNRPELYLSELLVKFNDYGQQVEAIKNNAFTVDLTSSYGKYEGAYKTEKMRQSDNWYIGFKATKPFGPSTLNSAYTREKTQPRFGQTSPTESSTISGELNLLDNLRRLSDKKRADIDLQRSMSDFDETLKTITFEVQDAFLNYQKALLGLNTAENEIKFRRSQMEVIKIRALVGEASLSATMEALYTLGESQTKYLQALSSYQISLVNLKKATGYGLKI